MKQSHTFGEFCGIFAYELRVHLTTIRGCAALMEAKQFEDGHDEFVRLIKNGTMNIYAMIEAMIEYARIVENDHKDPIRLPFPSSNGGENDK